jgi:hypothetical protein
MLTSVLRTDRIPQVLQPKRKPQFFDAVKSGMQRASLSQPPSRYTSNLHTISSTERACVSPTVNSRDLVGSIESVRAQVILNISNAPSKVLKSHFGLEAVILHEILGGPLNDFLLTLDFWIHAQGAVGNGAYTLCYLTLATDSAGKHIVGGRTAPEKHQQFGQQGDHKAFQQVIDPSLLALSENQRLRFKKAMRMLGISPHYHLSELEPHVQHPIEDEDLADLCMCSKSDCDTSPDIHPWDKAYHVECYLEEKSKGRSRSCPGFHT